MFSIVTVCVEMISVINKYCYRTIQILCSEKLCRCSAVNTLATRWRQTSQNPKICRRFFLTVQDTTEYTETAEENSHNEEEEEDEEDEEEVSACVPSINNSVPVAEVVRIVEEMKTEPALREVLTPPPRVPAKLLPRLGSLDSQYHMTIHFNSKGCSECCLGLWLVTVINIKLFRFGSGA